MSVIEAMTAEASELLSPEQDEKARKRARELISEALISAGNPLEDRGVKSRLLPALWYASVSILITILTPEEALAFLQSRYQTVFGFGDNANSPARKLDDKAMGRYVKQVTYAASTIMEKLELALVQMERENIEDRFPETVFDVALKVILPAWGPDHVRRAIMEQCALLIKGLQTGKVEIKNFMEPEKFMSPAQKPVRRQGADTSEGAAEKVLSQYRVKRIPSERHISCFIGVDRLDDERASWAIVMKISSSGGRHERRDVYGAISDKIGNKVIEKAMHEFALAICLEETAATVDVRMTDQNLFRCMPDQENGPANYMKFDQAIWQDIAACFSRHAIRSRLVDISLTDEQQEHCDKILKNPNQ